MTELQLIEGCRRQDRKSQHALYERYCDAMYTVAYRITADADLAAEVLQDAFVQVFRHIERFEGRSAVGAWIKAIVVREALHTVRRRPAFDELAPAHTDERIDWGAQPIDAEYLEKAIQALPDGCRAVFVLAEIEGYTHREIAELLGIGEGTSKSQLSYAKKSLSAVLQHTL